MTTEGGSVLYFDTNSNTYTVSNLEPYTVYQFELAAETVAGRGPFSISMPFLTGEAGIAIEKLLSRLLYYGKIVVSTDPTAPPDSLTVTSIGSTYVEVRWNAPDSSEHNGIIRFYKVFILEEGTGRNFTLTSTNTQIVATDLHPFYTYNVSVAAVTISPGPYSQHLLFRTLEDGMYFVL